MSCQPYPYLTLKLPNLQLQQDLPNVPCNIVITYTYPYPNPNPNPLNVGSYNYFNVGFVYFDQPLGAAHSKHWPKYTTRK